MDGDFRDLDAGRASPRATPRRMTADGSQEPTDPGAASAETRLPETLPAYDVRRLMRGGGQAHLVLDGVAYSLRITRAGKLILTK